MRRILAILVAATILFISTNSFAWHDETHLAISKAAGYEKWYNSAAPDVTKIKAGAIEGPNHYYNNAKRKKVTQKMVLKQAELYDSAKDQNGHLYGAIIASIRKYKKAAEEGKYAEYHLAFLSHYIGDLSQPLHNTEYNEFNKIHHIANDATIDKEVLQNVDKIKNLIYPVKIRKKEFENDLAREVARIANISRKLEYKLEKENRDMTKEEAYGQIAHSASLLKSILLVLKKSN